METTRCPKCGATSVIAGKLIGSGAGGGVCGFRPIGTRPVRMITGVGLAAEVLACSSCGLVWTQTEPAVLREFIQKYGTELGRQYFESVQSGSEHGVPDIPEARTAASRVSEIDALMLVGKHGPAARHYRAWTGCTWDEAHESLRKWHRLKRVQKLALLGWAPKEPCKTEQKGLAAHPMRDRWLDG